jgi:hypothetical protein
MRRDAQPGHHPTEFLTVLNACSVGVEGRQIVANVRRLPRAEQ